MYKYKYREAMANDIRDYIRNEVDLSYWIGCRDDI